MYCVGLPLQALVQVAAVVDPLDLGQLMLGMREQINALAPQRVRQQDLRRQSRDGNPGFLQQASCPGAEPCRTVIAASDDRALLRPDVSAFRSGRTC